MGYDANGNWKPEDASVQKQVADIVGQDSSLMRQAKTSGLQTANARGLLNSTAAIQASQNAVLGAATPIASQTASQINQQNTLVSQQAQETKENAANRAQTQQLAELNVLTDKQNKAAAMIASMEQIYSQDYAALMGNSAMNGFGGGRSEQAASINARRQQMLSFVEQMYNIDLTW